MTGNITRPIGRRLLLALLLLTLPTLPACLPAWLGGATTGVDPTAGNTEPAIADSAATESPPPATDGANLVTPPAAGTAQPSGENGRPAVEPAADRDEEAAPEFTVKLSDEERNKLIDEAEHEIAETLRLLATKAPDSGDTRSEKEAEIVRTVEDFLTASRAALENDDPSSAAALAKKARLLAEEYVAGGAG